MTACIACCILLRFARSIYRYGSQFVVSDGCNNFNQETSEIQLVWHFFRNKTSLIFVVATFFLHNHKHVHVVHYNGMHFMPWAVWAQVLQLHVFQMSLNWQLMLLMMLGLARGIIHLRLQIAWLQIDYTMDLVWSHFAKCDKHAVTMQPHTCSKHVFMWCIINAGDPVLNIVMHPARHAEMRAGYK